MVLSIIISSSLSLVTALLYIAGDVLRHPGDDRALTFKCWGSHVYKVRNAVIIYCFGAQHADSSPSQPHRNSHRTSCLHVQVNNDTEVRPSYFLIRLGRQLSLTRLFSLCKVVDGCNSSLGPSAVPGVWQDGRNWSRVWLSCILAGQISVAKCHVGSTSSEQPHRKKGDGPHFRPNLRPCVRLECLA